jgi:hypothetical protein
VRLQLTVLLLTGIDARPQSLLVGDGVLVAAVNEGAPVRQYGMRAMTFR